ncbi:hypothetical protein ES705_47367 [subsurface metagenome]
MTILQTIINLLKALMKENRQLSDVHLGYGLEVHWKLLIMTYIYLLIISLMMISLLHFGKTN